ncbi:hypothetical protein MOQ72_38065 [Saccharopolyspora sp. K220]|uniref:hypothetical protein n=1 Tax=Saccharopolyspora soli TaxID=2926618 RepID=UPI001F5A5FB4|nr:hypothetical protein [Saccharopolyspora soli]MCI2423242.1 hypothetical protein [Saccharopolyspora soli]
MRNPTTAGNPRQAMSLTLGAACALLTAFTATGCGASDDTGAPAQPTSTPVAADGTNIDACSDGNCEVALTGPTDIRLTGQGGGITTLSVVEVNAAGVRFNATSAEGGSSSGELTGGCTLRFYDGGGGSSCGGHQAPPEPETGVLAMQLVDFSNGTAVLRLVAGEPGPPPGSLVPPIPQIPEIPQFDW